MAKPVRSKAQDRGLPSGGTTGPKGVPELKGRRNEKLKRLKGKLHIIYGNHCTDTRKNRYSELPNLVEASYATMLRYGKWNFYLSHYPTIVGGIHNTKDKLWNLCGHSHTKDRFTDMEYKAYHVELDCHNNMPISIDDIILDIKEWRVLNNEIY